MFRRSLLLLLSFALISCFVSAKESKSQKSDVGSNREEKIFSLFQVVQFPNDVCIGSNSKNGTCYTSAECSSKGGTSAGTCASGYGICCTFTVNCGQTSNQNCTYFESAGGETGPCVATICQLNNNICQLRLDFASFVITGPSTSTVSVAKILNGNVVTGATAGVSATPASECLTDTFTVTNPASMPTPVICGVNTGEHMYVESSKVCSQLAFQLAALSTAAVARSWRIKITQYACDFPNLAPNGCMQYFFGTSTNSVRSYNYNAGSGYQLANQNQNICVRRERGNCRICWTTAIATDFMLSGNALMVGLTKSCCTYGTAGLNAMGYDCVLIPSATQQKTLGIPIAANAFCGRSMGLVAKLIVNGIQAAIATTATVCSRKLPFALRFISDNYELASEVMIGTTVNVPMKGFQLTYVMSGC